MTDPLKPEEMTLGQCFTIQKRVLWALVLREMVTRFGRHNIGVLWLLVEPIMFVLGIAVLWSMVESHVIQVGSPAEFAAVSYSTVLLWRNPSSRMTKAIEANQSLLYHRYVRPADFFISRIMLEYAGGTAAFLVIYIVFMAFGITHLPYDPLKMILGWFMIAWFAFSFAILSGALTELSETVDKFWHVVMYFMMPISGSFFPLYVMPPNLRTLLQLSPLVDATEYFHAGYYGPAMQTYYNLTYMAVFDSIFMLFSLSLLKIAGRRVQPE